MTTSCTPRQGEAACCATDPSPSPLPEWKRSKTKESLKEPNGTGRKSKREFTRKTSKSTTDFVQTKPYFNPLLAIPESRRLGLLLSAWGMGNFGQFRMGEDQCGKIHKPVRNRWAIAACGLYPSFADENGTVCNTFYPFNHGVLISPLGLVVCDEQQCCPWKNHSSSTSTTSPSLLTPVEASLDTTSTMLTNKQSLGDKVINCLSAIIRISEISTVCEAPYVTLAPFLTRQQHGLDAGTQVPPSCVYVPPGPCQVQLTNVPGGSYMMGLNPHLVLVKRNNQGTEITPKTTKAVLNSETSEAHSSTQTGVALTADT